MLTVMLLHIDVMCATRTIQRVITTTTHHHHYIVTATTIIFFVLDGAQDSSTSSYIGEYIMSYNMSEYIMAYYSLLKCITVYRLESR